MQKKEKCKAFFVIQTNTFNSILKINEFHTKSRYMSIRLGIISKTATHIFKREALRKENQTYLKIFHVIKNCI
jgi:hypothetical protein